MSNIKFHDYEHDLMKTLVERYGISLTLNIVSISKQHLYELAKLHGWNVATPTVKNKNLISIIKATHSIN